MNRRNFIKGILGGAAMLTSLPFLVKAKEKKIPSGIVTGRWKPCPKKKTFIGTIQKNPKTGETKLTAFKEYCRGDVKKDFNIPKSIV